MGRGWVVALAVLAGASACNAQERFWETEAYRSKENRFIAAAALWACDVQLDEQSPPYSSARAVISPGQMLNWFEHWYVGNGRPRIITEHQKFCDDAYAKVGPSGAGWLAEAKVPVRVIPGAGDEQSISDLARATTILFDVVRDRCELRPLGSRARSLAAMFAHRDDDFDRTIRERAETSQSLPNCPELTLGLGPSALGLAKFQPASERMAQAADRVHRDLVDLVVDYRDRLADLAGDSVDFEKVRIYAGGPEILIRDGAAFATLDRETADPDSLKFILRNCGTGSPCEGRVTGEIGKHLSFFKNLNIIRATFTVIKK